MEITEVRIKLMEDQSERLQAFCSITFDDCFVIRDLKIIEGTNGPFVAMPSRKLTGHCPRCGAKNHLRAAYCNGCGGKLSSDRTTRDEDGRAKLYADIAHPINSTCRELIQQRVIAAFQQEVEQAKLPGYVSRYDDIDQDGPAVSSEGESPRAARPAAATLENTHIQPPQRPAGPHRVPARAAPAAQSQSAPHLPAQTETSSSVSQRDGFGAGIF